MSTRTLHCTALHCSHHTTMPSVTNRRFVALPPLSRAAIIRWATANVGRTVALLMLASVLATCVLKLHEQLTDGVLFNGCQRDSLRKMEPLEPLKVYMYPLPRDLNFDLLLAVGCGVGHVLSSWRRGAIGSRRIIEARTFAPHDNGESASRLPVIVSHHTTSSGGRV